MPTTSTITFRMMPIQLLALLFWFTACSAPASETQSTANSPADTAQTPEPLESEVEDRRVRTGAEILVESRMDMLKNRRVAIVANQTSRLFDGTHLVDKLHELKVNITKVFAPEHGFRGDQDAGARISNSVDEKTGIPIASLYGKNKKPTAEVLKDVDIVLFDIQDVGARFYTYISTMSYVMEACAENRKAFVVLDRPNPNGWYMDGPVMEDAYKSFIGMHNVPIVHGMTVGEYARMVNGEGWLKDGVKCILDVIQCDGYTHDMQWEATGLPWVAPSPNLGTEYSAYLYPMLCWMEGMSVSVGRGTPNPFELFGAPWHQGYHYQLRKDSVNEAPEPSGFQLYGLEMEYLEFTPRSIKGKSSNPKFKDKKCYGARFTNRVDGKSLMMAGLSLLKNF
ncbi:MAG: DUF1343 domain-containing protein, partial [Bacteroidota bacterium]